MITEQIGADGNGDRLDQVLNTLSERRPLTPDQRHMLSVLEDAVACLRGIDQLPWLQQRRLSRVAKRWLMANDNRNLFAFRNVCETLAVDPELIRFHLNLSKGKRQLFTTNTLAAKAGRSYTLT